jgi:hypothetical protein
MSRQCASATDAEGSRRSRRWGGALARGRGPGKTPERPRRLCRQLPTSADRAFLSLRAALVALALGLALALAANGLAYAQPGQVDGFRSAKFGADEKAVRAAIKADFSIEASAVKVEENALEKTTALVIEVPALEPGGKAQVAYILGYQSRKLIQVNVVWGAPIDPAAGGDHLTGAAVLLRNYFAEQPFPADRRVQDQRLPDGSALFFQGADPKGRQVSLILFAGSTPAKAGEKPAPIYSLRLSYIADPRAPDVYRLKAGSF